MWRSPTMSFLVGRITQRGVSRIQNVSSSYRSTMQAQISNQSTAKAVVSFEGRYNIQDNQHNIQDNRQHSEKNDAGVQNDRISANISRKERIDFLVKTLLDLDDTKEAVYGALDAWVAWEQNFPIASLKRAMLALEKEQQWHRIVQVIKWMLSKGQGTTMGTYCQLIRALDMDQRADEAHKFWEKKIGIDLHSVPWQLCRQMIGIYYRNNMLENLVKLFEGLEAFDRKPPEKTIVQRVANAYELLGKLEEKQRVLEKYNHLLTETESLKKKKKFFFFYNKKQQPVKKITDNKQNGL